MAPPTLTILSLTSTTVTLRLVGNAPVGSTATSAKYTLTVTTPGIPVDISPFSDPVDFTIANLTPFTAYSVSCTVSYSAAPDASTALLFFQTPGTEIVPFSPPLVCGFLTVPPGSPTTLTFPDIEPALNANTSVSALMVSSTAGAADAANSWIISAAAQEQFGGSILLELAGSPLGTLSITYQIGAYNAPTDVLTLPVTYPLPAAPADILNVYNTPFPASNPVNGGCAQIVVNVTNGGATGFVFYVYTQNTIFARVDVGISNNTVFLLSVPGLTLFRVAYTTYTGSGRITESALSNKYPALSSAPLLFTPVQPYDLAPNGNVTSASYAAGSLALGLANLVVGKWITAVNYTVRSVNGIGIYRGTVPYDAGLNANTTRTINITVALPPGLYSVEATYTNQFSTSVPLNSVNFTAP